MREEFLALNFFLKYEDKALTRCDERTEIHKNTPDFAQN